MLNATTVIVIAAVIIITVPSIIAIIQAFQKLQHRKSQISGEPVKSAAEKTYSSERYDINEQPYKQGGMSTIWLAKDRTTGKPCVIKTPRRGTTMDHVYLEKLMLEASILKKLNHRGIVNYIEEFYHKGEFHLVLEYLNGETLMTLSPRLSPGEDTVVNWACQLLDALYFIHGAGIIHRDVNPKNIILCPDGAVKLIDFGTAKNLKEDNDTTKIQNDPFTQIANKGFDIPELFIGGESDGRCDLCGLAQTCIYLLTLRYPNELCNNLIKTNWPRTYNEAGIVADFLIRMGISRRTSRCLSQAILFSPDKRFNDARAMLSALSSNTGMPIKPVEAVSPG